jgi:hypothetical protein
MERLFLKESKTAGVSVFVSQPYVPYPTWRLHELTHAQSGSNYYLHFKLHYDGTVLSSGDRSESAGSVTWSESLTYNNRTVNSNFFGGQVCHCNWFRTNRSGNLRTLHAEYRRPLQVPNGPSWGSLQHSYCFCNVRDYHDTYDYRPQSGCVSAS